MDNISKGLKLKPYGHQGRKDGGRKEGGIKKGGKKCPNPIQQGRIRIRL